MLSKKVTRMDRMKTSRDRILRFLNINLGNRQLHFRKFYSERLIRSNITPASRSEKALFILFICAAETGDCQPVLPTGRNVFLPVPAISFVTLAEHDFEAALVRL
jgi:hypothetical protein